MSLEDAWAASSTTPRRRAGTSAGPAYEPGHRQWALYAFDTTEKAHIGKRSREWTAVHPTQEGVIREMARCLREISEGRVLG